MLWGFSKYNVIYVCICLGKMGIFCVLKDFSIHILFPTWSFWIIQGINSFPSLFLFMVQVAPYFTETQIRLMGIVLVLENRRAKLFWHQCVQELALCEQGLWFWVEIWVEITIFMVFFVSVSIQRPPRLQCTNGLLFNFSLFLPETIKMQFARNAKRKIPTL